MKNTILILLGLWLTMDVYAGHVNTDSSVKLVSLQNAAFRPAPIPPIP